MTNSFDTQRLFSILPKIEYGNKTFDNRYGETKSFFFESEPYKGKITSTFCYIGVPNKKMPRGGFPGIILAHGGGGCAFYEWVEYWNSKGYVAIAVDFSGRQYGTVTLDGPAGFGKVETNPSARPADYGSGNEDNNTFYDSWIYHSVSNAVLAHNVLLNNEYVNPQKTVMTGISWGGVLTCITAGVDDRFAAFSPVYGSGFLENCTCISLKNKDANELTEWKKLYDPSAYLGNCERPILFTLGMDDPCFSSSSNMKSSKLCKGKVYYSYRGSLSHYHRWKDEEAMAVVEKFFSSIVNNKPLPFCVTSSKRSDNRVKVTVDNPNEIKKILFYYTENRGEDFNNWKWENCEVCVNPNGVIETDIPKNTAVCFFQMSDCGKKEFILSSELFYF